MSWVRHWRDNMLMIELDPLCLKVSQTWLAGWAEAGLAASAPAATSSIAVPSTAPVLRVKYIVPPASHVRIGGHPVPPRLPVPESIRRPPAVCGARNSEAIVVMNLPVAGPPCRLPSVPLY